MFANICDASDDLFEFTETLLLSLQRCQIAVSEDGDRDKQGDGDRMIDQQIHGHTIQCTTV